MSCLLKVALAEVCQIKILRYVALLSTLLRSREVDKEFGKGLFLFRMLLLRIVNSPRLSIKVKDAFPLGESGNNAQVQLCKIFVRDVRHEIRLFSEP